MTFPRKEYYRQYYILHRRHILDKVLKNYYKVRNTSKYKAQKKKYYSRPDVVLHRKEYVKKYRESRRPASNIDYDYIRKCVLSKYCPRCNSSHIQKIGGSYTKTGRIQRFKCVFCGFLFQERYRGIYSLRDFSFNPNIQEIKRQNENILLDDRKVKDIIDEISNLRCGEMNEYAKSKNSRKKNVGGYSIANKYFKTFKTKIKKRKEFVENLIYPEESEKSL